MEQKALAAHLLNADDNEHIDVHCVRGFMATDVTGALQEIEAIARATQCKQPLFSLSLSPPKYATVSNQNFDDAINEALSRTGLSGMPHVVIFHEKHGRRHAHVVASRIDTNAMKAVNLSFFKDRLMELSRELFVTHGWDMPKGHEDRALSDPLNYTLEEYQVSARSKRDPQTVKSALQTCWAQSDSKQSFTASLREAGFALARGDRRGFVAVDTDGNIYSLSRWLGVKTKELKSRLVHPQQLPSVQQAIETLAAMRTELREQDRNANLARIVSHIEKLTHKKKLAIAGHRSNRAALRATHDTEIEELAREFIRTKNTLRGLFHWATGRRHQLVSAHRAGLTALREKHDIKLLSLSSEQCAEIRALREEVKSLENERDRITGHTPNAENYDLVRPPRDEALFTAAQIRKSPVRILEVLTDTEASFSSNDIRRSLARYIQGHADQRAALEAVLTSPKLMKLGDDRFTSKAYHNLESDLFARAKSMVETKAFGVNPSYLKAAIERQNKALQSSVGANLSDEQCNAIKHALNRRQLCAVVGYAGAGKSTMLAAAKDAWTQQGYRVLGAALAGKAADGLQQASGIPSRTLASWEMSWKNGRSLLKPGDVMVIDEASMVGSAQMACIVREVQKRQAKLVLVGDPAQLSAINAGTPYAGIVERTGAARLTEIRRQKLDWQKRASRNLAEGRIDDAMRVYEESGAVTYAESTDSAVGALVEAYMADLELHGNDKSRLALAQTRAGVHAINGAIRAARKSAGDFQDETIIQTDHGPRAFAPGDRIVFTKNVARLGLRNGMHGTVTLVGNSKLRVGLEDGQFVTIPYRKYLAFDHGYATTIHKAQGVTVDHSYVLTNRNMNAGLKYVALTRHRDGLQVFSDLSLRSEKIQKPKDIDKEPRKHTEYYSSSSTYSRVRTH